MGYLASGKKLGFVILVVYTLKGFLPHFSNTVHPTITQIKNYVKTHLPNSERAKLDMFESRIRIFANSRFIVSQLYEARQSMCLPKMDNILEKWGRELVTPTCLGKEPRKYS